MNPSEAPYIRSGAVLSLHTVIHHLIDGALPIEVVVGLVTDAGLFGGSPPVDDAIRIGTAFDLLIIADSEIRLSSDCVEKIVPHCSQAEPKIESARQIIFKILTQKLPTWIAFFSAGPDVFRNTIPERWAELLDEAELLNLDENEVLNWWKELLNRFHQYEDAKAKAIGDVGESLTVGFEKDRVRLDNLGIDPDITVIWVARLPGDHGYDVRSIRGNRFQATKSKLDVLFLEAKSSTGTSVHSFRFYLTRNEWNTAMQDLSRFYVYCWTGIDVSSSTASAGPFVIPAVALMPHVPVNPTQEGEWTECQFVLDLNRYAI